MRIETTESDVIVFHDETSKAGVEKLNGHILLFVPIKLKIISPQKTLFENNDPINSMKSLFSKISELRDEYGTDQKFHFKEISGKKWTKYNEAEKKLVEIGVDALRCKNPRIFCQPLHCKIAVIFFPEPIPNNIALYGGDEKKEKRLRFYETLLRMLLKGAVHYLYDKNNKVKIMKLITDGEPYHRKLSNERILNRLIEESLAGGLRNYVEIDKEAEIVHVFSDHKNYQKDSEEYVYANMLQLADMFLGSIIQACLKGIKWQKMSLQIGKEVEDKKSIIAYPIKEMLDKRKRGSNFKYSSHYKSFAISKAYIENEEWKFENIISKEIEIEIDEKYKITLFDFEEGSE